MNTIKVILEDFAYFPQKINNATYSLLNTHPTTIYMHDSIIVDTKVHLKLPDNCYVIIQPNSSLCNNHNILGIGSIEADSSIKVKLFNLGDMDYTLQRGEPIANLVIYNTLGNIDMQEVKEL